jgi:hypothetical protein
MVDSQPSFDPAHMRTAPGVARCAEFDFPAVEAALGEIESGVPEQCREELARALRAVVVWLCEPRQRGTVDVREVGRRAVALTYLIAPDSLEHRSLSKLAGEIGASLSDMSRHSASARRKFQLAGNAFSSHSRHSFKTDAS